MAELITQSNNPVLWGTLNDALQKYSYAGYVVISTILYEVHRLTSGDTAFKEVSNIDFIDSRSITGSKKASYKDLDG